MSNPQEKRHLILETATGLFARYGFSKTSLDDIAATAQIAKGTVYYYFSSKEELFMAAVEQKAECYFDLLRQHLDAVQGFEAKLHEFLRAPIKVIFEYMPVLIESLRNLPLAYQEQMQEFKQRNRQRMLEMLREIIQIGYDEGVLSQKLTVDRLCEVLIDWYLMGDTSLSSVDMPQLVARMERDHEIIIQLILYGILKRG